MTTAICSFNGAAAFRLRKLETLANHRYYARRASMGPQPFDCGNTSTAKISQRFSVLLQWGRSLSTAEIALLNYHACAADAQLQWGRSLSTAEMPNNERFLPCQSSPLQWGRSLSTAEIGNVWVEAQKLVVASMGPQPFDCGNVRCDSATRPDIFTLQWGRSLSTAEMTLRGVREIGLYCFNGAAAFRLRK